MQYKGSDILDRELKKGSAELLILSLVEDRPRHGYESWQLDRFNRDFSSSGVAKDRAASSRSDVEKLLGVAGRGSAFYSLKGQKYLNYIFRWP